MKSVRERRPFLVGIVSLFLIAAAVGLAFSINRFEGLRGVYTLSADLKDAAGLQPGNEVRVAGVKVGQVKSLRLAPGAARVIMEIDQEVRIPLTPPDEAAYTVTQVGPNCAPRWARFARRLPAARLAGSGQAVWVAAVPDPRFPALRYPPRRRKHPTPPPIGPNAINPGGLGASPPSCWTQHKQGLLRPDQPTQKPERPFCFGRPPVPGWAICRGLAVCRRGGRPAHCLCRGRVGLPKRRR